MLGKFYIAKQPILDLNNEIYAYELLFRTLDKDGNLRAVFADGLLATATVLVNALNHFGMTSLVDDNLAFVNIDEEFLMDPLIFSIPKERFVLEILEATRINKRVIKRIKELKEHGFRFALDDVHCSDGYIEKFTPIFPYLDILKLDVSLILDNTLEKYLEDFKQYDFKLLAEKVETQEVYDLFKSHKCTFFQGYYFSKPAIVQRDSIDPAYKKIFHLINLLDNEYTEMDEIVEELESEIELTIQLLRFMNSLYIGLRQEVKSIKHVLMLLGKKPLKQWLLLIAFSKSMGNEAKISKNPILELAITRSKIMSQIAKKAKNVSYDFHEASFVGVLSLVDALLKVPMEMVLKEISIDDNVRDALLHREGDLGELLNLVIAIEQFDMPLVEKLSENFSLTNGQIGDILQESYVKVQEF